MGRSRTIVPARVSALVVVAVLAVASCDSEPGSDAQDSSADVVTVGSFNFPESELLAEIYSQALEAGGFPVSRSFGLGPRELVVPALVRGMVGLVPEYAGTAAQFLGAGDHGAPPGGTTTERALRLAVGDLPVRFLAPAPAEDANTFVMRRTTAARHRVQSLSDLSSVAPSLVFGGPPECSSRPLCLQGLRSVYGITFGEVVPLDAGGPLTHQALEAGVIDVALLFTTDPLLDGTEVVELTDDLRLQPPENVTPLVHQDVLDRWGPELVERIDDTSSHLTTAALRRLNELVAAGSDDIGTIAARWLEDEGIA